MNDEICMIPPGWRLMPEAPTPDMLKAMGYAVSRYASSEQVYEEMLASAPRPDAALRLLVLQATIGERDASE